MSHLLSTTNPAAAAAIQPAAKSLPLPGVGNVVVYTMRLGHGRNGRTRFPAIVQDARMDGTLDLTVVIDAGDLSDEIMVREAAVGNETHCWERPAGFGPMLPGDFEIEEPTDAVPDAMQALRDEVTELRKIILGDYEAPPISIIDALVEFEGRLNEPASAPAKKRGRPATKRK